MAVSGGTSREGGGHVSNRWNLADASPAKSQPRIPSSRLSRPSLPPPTTTTDCPTMEPPSPRASRPEMAPEASPEGLGALPNELAILNAEPRRLPGPQLLHELVKFTSPKGLPALLCHPSSGSSNAMNYEELHFAADGLATRILQVLGGIGVTGAQIIPLLVPQCRELYISLLAILKAGGAFCPLNLDAPPERIRFILEDVSARVVLATKEQASKIPAKFAGVVIIVDEQVQDIAVESIQSLSQCAIATPESLAYVMYTSGSTGTPKGVGVSHLAATQSLLAHDRHIPNFERFLQFAAPTFDVSVFEIFFPLTRGCSIVTCDRATLLNDLPGAIRRMNVDACELTPTVAGSLLRSRQSAPSLRLLLTIGEMLAEPVVREFGGSDDAPSMLWAMYGPTEATIHCTLQPASRADDSPRNIGIPLDTVSCFVIDLAYDPRNAESFHVLAKGQVGELVVGGYQLASGYINRPEQTNEVFIKSPYGLVYRTGDKARILPDGRIECLGRIADGQVKLRGQRLELGEVEQAVLKTTCCHGVVAAVLGSVLVAFCAIDDDTAPDEARDRINKSCKAWLPSYMAPGDLVLVKEFPRLASGKVDRKQLCANYESSRKESRSGRNEVFDGDAQQVAKTVEQLTGRAVEPSASMSAIGIDSLIAIQLSSKLRGIGFPVHTAAILECSLLSDLVSTALEARKRAEEEGGPSTEDSVLLPTLVEQYDILAECGDVIDWIGNCTPLQRSMLAETTVNRAAYCNRVEIGFGEDVQLPQVVDGFHALARENEILRTGFVHGDDGFAQVVFKELGSDQIRQVSAFQPSFLLVSEEDYLAPLLIEVKPKDANTPQMAVLHIHHAIYDGWSMDMMLRDLSKLIRGDSLDSRPQFRDVVKFFDHGITEAELNETRAFWAQYLLGWQKLPFPRLASCVDTTPHVGILEGQIGLDPGVVSRKLEELACAPTVVFQAAVLLLLGAMQGTSDVVMGSVTSGRTIPIVDIDRIIGPCIAPIPLRADTSGLSSVADLLSSIQTSNRSILQHSILPLSEIKKVVGLQPGESLYDVLFTYQESPFSRSSDFASVFQTSHQDLLETGLLIEIEPRDFDFRCIMTFHTDMVPEEHAKMLLSQLERLIQRLLDSLTGKLETIFAEFDDTMLSTHNLEPEMNEGRWDLAMAFEESTSKHPQADALRFLPSLDAPNSVPAILSYHELNSRANQIARYLIKFGVSPGEIVGISMQKSVLLYASILGIIKARCAYLPILPTTPVARIQSILATSEVSHCIIDDNAPENELREVSGLHVQNLEHADLDDLEGCNLDLLSDCSRLAYVIYTSGTTGSPKGVAVTQLNIMSNIEVLSAIYPINHSGRLLQACSQAFDVSVFEIFYTWISGLCLCAGTNDTIFADLEKSIRDMEITHLSLTPTVASLVNPRNVPRVEFLVTAGEPMTSSVQQRWGQSLFQGYGPSELTNICTVKRMDRADHIEHLGHALSNTSSVVLVPGCFDVVPVGCVGELCFGGDQVAAGYLNMPDVTASKFIQHPKYGRLCRTGDLGRMLVDGSLMVLGRLDGQLKLRGQRIEAAEVDSLMTSTGRASASSSLIVSRKDGDQSKLVTFYIPMFRAHNDLAALPFGSITTETNAQLSELLSSHLPSYMVPSYLVPITTIPRTVSGKIDSTKLRTLFASLDQGYLNEASTAASLYSEDADWTDREQQVVRIISDILKIPQLEVGRWTPLSALGVDSISAIRLAKSLKPLLGYPITVSDILRNDSVAQVSRLNAGATDSSEDEKAPLLPSDVIESIRSRYEAFGKGVDTILPCTPLQQAMLASKSTTSYFNRMTFRLHVSVEDMKRCWHTMTRRHNILRTCFEETLDSSHPFVQVVLSDWDLPWSEVDTPEWSASGMKEPLDQHGILSHFIGSGTPPAWIIISKEKNSTYLSMVCHHALYDGVGIESLFDEIEHTIKHLDLPLVISYGEFLVRSLSLSPETRQFWVEQFRGFQRCRMVPQPAGSSRGGVLSARLRSDLRNLEASIRALSVSLLSLSQAAWATTISVAMGCADICFGLVMSGRTVDVEGIDRLVAPCFNTIPVRCDVSRFRQKTGLLRHFQKLNPSLLEHQFTPLRSIQGWVSKDGSNLFDSLLLLQKPSRRYDESVWELKDDVGSMDLPLVCEVIPVPHQNMIDINMHYDGHVFSDATATALLELFSETVDGYLKQPSSHPTRLSSELTPLIDRLVPIRLAVHQENEPDPSVESRVSSASESWCEDELLIRSVLAELSRVEIGKIRRQTTLFQLGLDSINAVQVASMLRTRGIKATAVDVIDGLSCQGISSKLKLETRNISQQYDIPAFQTRMLSLLRRQSLHQDGIESMLPCTRVQAAMLTEYLRSKGHHYFNYIRFRFRDGISAHSLSMSLEALVSRHSMLRTGFIETDFPDAPFAMLQYSSRSAAHSVAISRQGIEREFDEKRWKHECSYKIQRDLKQPPWAALIVEGGSHLEWHLAIHHALYDAQALDTILGDLDCILNGIALPPARRIDGCVANILGSSSYSEEHSRGFWEQYAEVAIPNKFPILTPLREAKSELVEVSRVSSISFDALLESTKEAKISIQAVVQAAWARLLASYLDERSVIFGVVLSGRTTEETRDTVFPCINTVPIIAECSSSNWQLLQSMMQYNAGLYEHQFAASSRIQSWLGHPQSALFDTLVVYQRLQSHPASSRVWQIEAEDASVEYPVSLEVEPLAGGNINLRLSFMTNVLPAEQAELILLQFDSIFDDLIYHPHGFEDDLSQNPASSIFSITPPANPELSIGPLLLHQFVEAEAQSNPKNVALEFVDEIGSTGPVSRTWSYDQLNEMGDRMANQVAVHAQPGSIVAIHFDKCPEAYFSILGILKAGCAFLALDISAPPSRKSFILEDCEASLLLVHDRSAVDFATPCRVIEVGNDFILKSPATICRLPRPPRSTDPCYCLYTSGTTGTPKGCLISHENAVQAMAAFQELFHGHWDATSRWLQFASFHFDVSVLEQYWSWSVGIRLVGAPRDLILDDLATSLNILQITHVDLTPSLARLIHPDEVPSLCKGVFITGGEQLRQEILDAWGPAGVIYNAYGPTEATIGVTMFQRVPRNGRAANIGRQFSNVGTYVLQPGTERPVLRGGVGELCISGKLVGLGYLKRPDLTSERFPTLKAFNERIYRTGDLVRILHDGCFEFLGRADDQVKLRGQRLEIGEINHAIRSVSTITNVATIVSKHEAVDRDMILSFIVCHANEDRNAPLQIQNTAKARTACHTALESCRSKLPGYMVPTYIFQIPRIPLSANNKVESKSLKQLFNGISQDELLRLRAAPQNDTSEADVHLREALGEFATLPVEQITGGSSIYDLGVDSISVLRLVRTLRRRGFESASPSLILQHPIVGDLSEALRYESPTMTENDDATLLARQAVQACDHAYRSFVCQELAVSADDVEYVAPCTALQEGMISRFMTSHLSGIYFNSIAFELESNISVQNLKSAWVGLVDAHSVLRTKFVMTSAGFLQVAMKSTPLAWREISLQDPSDIDMEITRARTEWISENQPHITKPLAFLHFVTKRGQTLIVNIFHGLYDAASFSIIEKQVASMYHGDAIPIHTQFLDVLVRGPLQQVETSREFWQQHLKGWKFQPVPSHSPIAGDTDVVAKKAISLQPILEIQKRHQVTLQAVVLALWIAVLKSQECDYPSTFGIICSGRTMDMDGIESIVGPLFNTVPMFLAEKEANCWSSLVRSCHRFCSQVLHHQHTPLRDIQKWCSGGTPLFDNLFSFQIENSTARPADGPWNILDDGAALDYPLACEAVATAEGMLDITIAAKKETNASTKAMRILETFEFLMPRVSTHADEELVSTLDGGIDKAFATSQNHAANAVEEIRPSVIVNSSHIFEWTDVSRSLREEIAATGGVSIETVTSSTGFFELGFDSIDVIKLSARLKQRGFTISSAQLMRYQTIASIVEQLGPTLGSNNIVAASPSHFLRLIDSLRNWASPEYTGFESEEIEEIWPPTPLQESMMAEMLNSSCRRYFNHDVLELSPDTDISFLSRAVDTLVAHSPILRTVFVPVEQADIPLTFCQVVIKPQPIKLRIRHLDRIEDIDKILSEAQQRVIDGHGRAELFQVVVLVIGDTRYLGLSIAHALYDGWSLGLLHQDLHSAYEGKRVKRPGPEKLLRSLFEGNSTKSQDFWSQYLKEAQATLVTATSSGGVRNPTVHRHERVSGVAGHHALAFARQSRVTLQSVGQTCWAIVLATLSQALDLTFGVVLSGRDAEEADKIMFPTMNTVAVRCIIHGTASTLAKYMQENMANIFEHQNLPLRQANRLAGAGPDGLFNTLFILQKKPERYNRSDEGWMKSIWGHSDVEYPLCIELEPSEDELIWRVACHSDTGDSQFALRLLDKLDHVLKFITESPDAHILRLQNSFASLCGLPPFKVRTILAPASAPTACQEEDDTWNELESAIRAVTCQVSGVSESSIRKSQSLHHLGLDSISAIKVSTMLRKQNIRIGVKDLISAKSITEIANSINRMRDRVDIPGSSLEWDPPEGMDAMDLIRETGALTDEIECVLPATPMQVYTISSWQNSEGRLFYPEFRYRVNDPNDLARIRNAWDAMVSKLKILRTIFIATGRDDVPLLQVAFRSGSQILDYAMHNHEGLQPLWQFETEQCHDGTDQQFFTLKIHHSLYDGASLPLIISGLHRSLDENALELSTMHGEWSRFVRSHTELEVSRRREAFWRSYLLPDDSNESQNPAEQISSTPYGSRLLELVKGASTKAKTIASFCSEIGVGVHALLFAAYAMTRRRLDNQVDAETYTTIFGIYHANRSTEMATAPYPTLSLLPLRVTIGQGSRLAELAVAVQDDLHTITAEPQCTVGLWEIWSWTGVSVDSFVNFLGSPVDNVAATDRFVPAPRSDGLSATRSNFNNEKAEWLAKNSVRGTIPEALDVEVAVNGDNLDIGVFGKKEKFRDLGPSAFINLFVSVLEEGIAG